MNKKKIFGALFAGAAFSAVLSACLLPVGDGEGLDSNGNVLPLVPPDTNLTLIYNQIFGQPVCRQCHQGNSTPSSQNPLNFFSLETAKQTLFNPDGSPRETFQKPGTAPIYRISKDSIPENSYVYEKVSKSAPKDGLRMPLNNDPLTDAQISLIRRWIELGAPIE